MRHLVNIECLPGCSYANNRVLVKEINNVGFCVGAVRRGEEARKVFQGPLVAGPWAYAFAVAGVIDRNGGSMREIEQERVAGVLVECSIDDILVVDGVDYRIERAPNRNIKLIPA